MYLMRLSQGENDVDFALFETIESGREFAKNIPGYQLINDSFEEIDYQYETISPEKLPDYFEVKYKGNKIPISRFSFRLDEDIDVFWKEIPNLDEENQNLVPGNTRIEAYVFPNNDVKEYIQKRELGYSRIKTILENLGYKARREGSGSEDGEFIVYQEKGSDETNFLVHMDPSFVEAGKMSDEELSKWVEEQIR